MARKEQETKVESGRSAAPSPCPRPGSLKTVEKVRAEMARLYRDCRQGTVSPQDGARLTFMLVNLAKLVEFQEQREERRRLDNDQQHDQGLVSRLVEILEVGIAAGEKHKGEDHEADQGDEQKVLPVVEDQKPDEVQPQRRQFYIPAIPDHVTRFREWSQGR
ncbi:MAG: hypothetical protein ABFD97_02875 [Syntrophobacter sp.]